MSNSILTNTSAMAALATLRSINDQLDTTQNRISSGMRVASASDNAAYWSIATTMRSDNKALSAVSDALGLGASTVDVAYTAMNSVVETLDDIKARLVSAKQPGVDKSKIQSEIDSLEQTIKSTAESANFSGSNWLSIDSSDPKGTVQSVVASLARDSNGQISLGTINVDTTNIALFDASDDGAGLLEKASGNSDTGTLAQTGTDAVSTVDGADAAATLDTGDVGFAGLTGTDTGKLSFDLTVGGKTESINIDLDATNGASLDTVVTAINDAINKSELAGKVTVAKNDGGGTPNGFAFTATTTDANVTLSNFKEADWGTVADATAKPDPDGATATSGTAVMDGIFSSMTLDDDDTISFTLNIDGTDHNILIDKATALKAGLSKNADTGNVDISDIDDFADVVKQALNNANLKVASVDSAGDWTSFDAAIDTSTNEYDIGFDASSGKLSFKSATTGATSDIHITNVQTSSGSADFNLMDLDITDATSDQIDAYINGIDKMIESVTTAASDLGATKTQIANQDDFVSSLMDSIDTGIGRLVDADMNEESTKLKALQTQQQLGIQALSIANSNSQSILSLFR